MVFTADGVRRIAELGWEVNERTENIGARRLHTLMERLLDEVSYNAADLGGRGEPVTVDADFVNTHLSDVAQDDDLSRFIL